MLKLSGVIPLLFVCVLGVCAGTSLTIYSINHKLLVMQVQCGVAEARTALLSVTGMNVRRVDGVSVWQAV
jgi:hypothetical protein